MSSHTWNQQGVIHYSLVEGNEMWSNRVYRGCREARSPLPDPLKMHLLPPVVPSEPPRPVRHGPWFLKELLSSPRLIVRALTRTRRLAQRVGGGEGLQQAWDFTSITSVNPSPLWG